MDLDRPGLRDNVGGVKRHYSYDSQVEGDFLGGLIDSVPAELLYRDFGERRAAGMQPSGDQRSFMMSPYVRKRVDQQMIDEVSHYGAFEGSEWMKRPVLKLSNFSDSASSFTCVLMGMLPSTNSEHIAQISSNSISLFVYDMSTSGKHASKLRKLSQSLYCDITEPIFRDQHGNYNVCRIANSNRRLAQPC